MTKRILAAVVFTLSALTLSAGSGRHGTGTSLNTHGTPRSCADLDITIDGRPAARDEQALTLNAAGSGAPLRIQGGPNSGMYVEGSDRRDVQVLVCKAAPTAADLAQIRVSTEDGLLSATSPAEDSWYAYFIVQAPRAMALDVDTSNGPIALEGLSGQVKARAQNGPIAIKNCPGTLDAQAQNGPISVSGAGGDLHVRTQNGPISVKLAGDAWDGPGLDARAVNGPVSLTIPDGYRSGAVVESAGRSPFRCKGVACDAGKRTWDDDGQRVLMGGGPTLVRLSTVNGPVTVSSASSDREED